MKNLIELQEELLRLSSELKQLERCVEDLKPKEPAYDMRADYASIQALARKEPIRNNGLSGLDKENQTRYLRLLCTAAGLDGDISAEQLLYLCRLAAGAGCQAEPDELRAMAYQTEYLDWKTAALDLKKAALPIMLDSTLVIHLAGRPPQRGLEFIAGLAALLECRDEDLRVCAQLAAALLTENFNAFQCVSAKRPYGELGYAVPSAWLEKTRVKCGSYRMSTLKNAELRANRAIDLFIIYSRPKIRITANEIVKNGMPVEAGTALVTFDVQLELNLDRKQIVKSENIKEDLGLPKAPPICAPHSGFVRYTTDITAERAVWVISPFDQSTPA